MKCIIVDDEPIARRGIAQMAAGIPSLEVLGSFGNASDAAAFMAGNTVDLIFLDIQMPGTNGLEFARSIPRTTLVVFTTAFSQYAVDSYEADAVDYLLKPIRPERFRRAVEKAASYHTLLLSEEKNASAEVVENDFIFIKSERKYHKVYFKNILFIEGLKDYVIIQMDSQRLITHMNLKAIHELLPQRQFLRANRSYIVNKNRIGSYNSCDIFIDSYEIGISPLHREALLNALTWQ